MKEIDGFFKRSQKFRSNAQNGKYFPILDKLHEIASNYQNTLPSTFAIENSSGFSIHDVEHTLSQIYPERKYSCRKIGNNIYCVR